MFGITFHRALLASSLAFLAAAATSGAAHAQLMEPDGFGPVPTNPQAQCNRGNTGNTSANGTIGCIGTSDIGDYNCCNNTLDNMSLIGLFKSYESDASGNVLVNYVTDAKTEPATFNPLCSIQGKMVMHGGGCQVDFGWYCADDSKSYSNPPVIHPLVTAAQIQAYAADAQNQFPTAWKNNDGAFLPKVGIGYEILGTALSDVATNVDFQNCASKKIGFAVLGGTNPGGAGVCTQNKYTEQRLNQPNTSGTPSGTPYITAVIYASKLTPGRFYVAVEDLPTSPTQFNPPVPGKGWTADGDFNDFVYIVEGVVCQGGGQLCTVPGQQGICATGVTSCVDSSSTAVPTCAAVFKPQPEICNAIDDDCNGTIDDGNNLCPSGQFCFKGACVSPCAQTGEFACTGGLVCVGQYCVDPACASLNCAADQTCAGGQCVGGCTGVTCTAGQQCVAGKCIDLCDARTQAGLPACPANFVCQNGACVPNCTCLPCPDPATQECQSNSTLPGYGRCVASGCSDGHCGTQLCVPGGNCIDPCGSNPCAAGQTCTAAKQYDPNSDVNHQYSCTNPNGTAAGGAGTAGSSGVVLGNQAGSGNNGAAAGPNALGPANSTSSLGCGCRMIGSRTQGLGLAALLGLSVLAMRRRRRN